MIKLDDKIEIRGRQVFRQRHQELINKYPEYWQLYEQIYVNGYLRGIVDQHQNKVL